MSDFSLLCGNCKSQGCCTNSAVPLAFDSDLAELQSIGKATDQFLHDRNVNGSIIKAINKKKNSTECIFWIDSKCSIYGQRPFDCRAYPFDILKINQKYHWIVYSCNPNSNWSWTEEYLQALEQDRAFSEVMQKVEIFSGNTSLVLPRESEKTPYVVLRKVQY
ncbi:MAG: YkgJ family cysteine cluster protein [Candidatus Nitrosotenuis sp.]